MPAKPVAEDYEACVWVSSDPDVATARERARMLARTLGFSVNDQASVEGTISELAINLLTYARSGEIRLEVVTDEETMGLRIVARDWGAAAEMLELSTVKQLAGEFDIERRVGRGTVVTLTKWRRSKSAAA